MAILSRRTLQRLINENAKFVKKSDTKKQLKCLNLDLEKDINISINQYLENEWEIIILNSLSKFGTLKYEEEIEGKKLDVLFEPFNNKFKVIGDITCVTGKQKNKKLLLKFKNAFEKILEKEDLSGYWKIFVNGNSRQMDFCKSKPRLMLEEDQWQEIFSDKNFLTFINRVQNNRDRRDFFNYQKIRETSEIRPFNQVEMFENVLIDIKIQYEPKNYYQVECSHFDDRKITKLEFDEIYNRLSNKYKEQFAKISKTKYAGYLGIFLCDGIGNTFKRGDLFYKSSEDVIHKFLNNHKKIDFVLAVSSEDKIIAKLFQGYGNKLDQELIQFLEEYLMKSFPKPARSVTNARRDLMNSFVYKEPILSSGGCGLLVSSNKVKISSRLLQKILAGKIDWDRVFYYLGFEGNSKTSSIPNRFLTMLNSGKLFSEIKIEEGENEKDDDWVVFEFKDDPAVSPFMMPDNYS